MTKMPRDLWKHIVESGSEAIATVLTFLSFFVWRLLTSESDVKNLQTVKIGCFTSPSIRGISEKQSFLVHFQLGIICYKKKKKKKYWVYVATVLVITLSRLATCPVSSSCSVTHVDGGHLLSAVSMTARIFSALATWKQCCFSVSHSKLFEYLIKLLKIYRAVAVMAANGVCKITQSNLTLISLITFEVLNQT